MLLQIVHFNDPVLRKKGEKITLFDASLAELADNLVETMHAAGGIGLAAQQIGQAVQLCVVDLRQAEVDYTWQLDGKKPPKELIMPLALANTSVAAEHAPTTESEEGCLSFPEIRGDVIRPDAAVPLERARRREYGLEKRGDPGRRRDRGDLV